MYRREELDNPSRRITQSAVFGALAAPSTSRLPHTWANPNVIDIPAAPVLGPANYTGIMEVGGRRIDWQVEQITEVIGQPTELHFIGSLSNDFAVAQTWLIVQLPAAVGVYSSNVSGFPTTPATGVPAPAAASVTAASQYRSPFPFWVVELVITALGTAQGAGCVLSVSCGGD